MVHGRMRMHKLWLVICRVCWLVLPILRNFRELVFAHHGAGKQASPQIRPQTY